MNENRFTLPSWTATAMLCTLVFLIASPCLASIVIEWVSKQQAAKEFNATIRTQIVGTNQVGVWLEFTPKGKLQTFSSVQLEMTSGGRTLVSTTLAPTKQTTNDVVVYFMTDPAQLPACSLTVYYRASGGLPPYDGIRFNLADFMNTDDASSLLQKEADEIHARIAASSKMDNYQLLMDAAGIADRLYPKPWPSEMTDQAGQMLRLKIEVINAIDSAIDRTFDPENRANWPFVNVMPPLMPTNPPGPIESGMDPVAITDPVARKAYEAAIETNKRKSAKFNREHSLKMALDNCANNTWIFLLNLRTNSPAYHEGIQIVEATVPDTNIVRKLKRPSIGSPD